MKMWQKLTKITGVLYFCQQQTNIYVRTSAPTVSNIHVRTSAPTVNNIHVRTSAPTVKKQNSLPRFHADTQ
jgi:hypothetical protein